MKHRIVILANSRKMGNRCIAGLDVRTGKWLRPCYGDGNEGIPRNVRLINGQEPQLLDVVEIPLGIDGPNLDYQPENRYLLDGPWNKVGTVEPSQIFKFCEKDELLLHNADRKIHVDKLLSLPPNDRRSLTLIKVHVNFSTGADIHRRMRVNASFGHGAIEYCIPVTDYEFRRRYPPYETSEADCILTISLGQPFENDNCCYKFVAGVITL
jgi:hypothetical protein